MSNKKVNIFHVINNANIIPYYHRITGKKINALCAYNYLPGNTLKLTTKYRQCINGLLLDSGAYSTTTGKANVNVSEYRRFVHQFGGWFDGCINFDNDFSCPENNFCNQVYLEEDLPKKLIPVIHDYKDPIGEFRMYADAEYDYIAIGSNYKLKDTIYEKIEQEYPHVKVHILGKIDRKLLKKHRPYSCDSASYALAAGYGNIFYWDSKNKQEHRIYLEERENKNKKIKKYSTFDLKEELDTFLYDTFKFKYEDLICNAYNRYVVNLYYFQQIEDYINSLAQKPNS